MNFTHEYIDPADLTPISVKLTNLALLFILFLATQVAAALGKTA